MASQEAYVLVIPVPGYRALPGSFAIESAFALHLRQLREKLGPLAENMVLVGPGMSPAQYEAEKSHLSLIDENREGIRFHPVFPADIGRLSYLLKLPGVMRTLWTEIRKASLVHAGNSSLYRPFEFPALLMARAMGKKTISVTDIDNRTTARMNLKTGRWSRKEYLVTRMLHDSFAHLQQSIGVRLFSLVLLKGEKLAGDYGKGRSNVKNFLDAACSEKQLIEADRLDAKVRALSDPALPVVFTYFGRLVAYKGIDHMLRAFHRAISLGARNVRLQIIGGGPELPRLTTLTDELKLGELVNFRGPVPFNALFEQLYPCHVLMAAPLSQDTPRNAIDAMASGQALVAYDTYYYRELASAGAPVTLVPWLDIEAMGRGIADLSLDRERLAGLVRQGVEFARSNTQEAWLDRRVRWTRELFGG
jgi:Glycosyltransferase